MDPFLNRTSGKLSGGEGLNRPGKMMFGAGSISVCLLFLILLSCKTPEETKPDLFSGRDQYLEWYKEAKFGMFIHWGPYSMYEGEWNGRQVTVGENSEWIMKKLTIPVKEYRKNAHNMNPVKFDAHEWVRLAKDAGMKYIVITAKHHDGFAMYHSRVTPYNIVDWTTFKRDPLKELSEACAEEGIKFCVYYSHREDWDHPGGYGNDWDYDNDWGDNLYDREKFEKYLEEKAKPQLRELLTGYGPLGLVWFDRGMYTPGQGREFASLVHEMQPATLINGRVGNYGQEFLGDYQSMSDNGMPPGGLEEYWETPMTLNQTWGFSKFDTLWKSPETVITRLVEIVSRGGNYLLNIGPRGNGEIPDATVEIFSHVGAWVNRNAEALYGTTANPFGELDWGYCTVKGERIFLFIREWPADRVLTLTGLQNQVTSAYPVIDKSNIFQVEQAENKTRITLSAEATDDPISVVVLETEGDPKVDPQVVLQDENGAAELDYLTVNTTGETATRFNRKGGFHISKWTGPDDAAEWIVHLTEPGKFRVDISYAANRDSEGKPYEVIIDNSVIEANTVYTGEWFEYESFPIGYIELPTAGDYTLTIRPVAKSEAYLMHFKSISLEPVSKLKTEGWGVN